MTTKTLPRHNITVLAHSNGDAKTYVNIKQAEKAAQACGGQVVHLGRVFFVRVNN